MPLPTTPGTARAPVAGVSPPSQRLTLQGVTVDALGVLATLPLHHRDPFDRRLIAQALDAQVALVSADTAFDAYPVQRLW